MDIIIALGMAKEGFDWVWCEHALTIGYRASLVEIVQIIGRATRDAPGKTQARFTNLVAEPGVETGVVADAVNDMLKAISGSLLMEQVLAPNFKFYRREDGDVREPISIDDNGTVTIGIKGLMEPPTDRARDICARDMHDLMAAACQAMDKRALSPETAPEVVTQMVLTDIIETRYENLTPEETESVRQDLAARMNILRLAKREAETGVSETSAEWEGPPLLDGEDDLPGAPNTLLALVRRFINVRELDIDLIDSVNTFPRAVRDHVQVARLHAAVEHAVGHGRHAHQHDRGRSAHPLAAHQALPRSGRGENRTSTRRMIWRSAWPRRWPGYGTGRPRSCGPRRSDAADAG